MIIVIEHGCHYRLLKVKLLAKCVITAVRERESIRCVKTGNAGLMDYERAIF